MVNTWDNGQLKVLKHTFRIYGVYVLYSMIIVKL